jgi:putative ABC transport system permease protein
MNNIIMSIKLALKSMFANKLRTALTVLGIVIGAASVIIVYSAGEGIRSLLLKQIESFGTDVLQTEIKVPSNKPGMAGEQESGSAIASGAQVTTLTIDDAEDLKKLSNIKAGYAATLSQDRASYGGEVRKVFLMGVGAEYIDIDRTKIAEGRFFTEIEDKNLSSVVVLGAGIKQELFGDSDAIGKSITIHKSKYQVIGVMEEKGKIMTMDFDKYVYLPVRTLQKKIMGINHVFYMVHQLIDPDKAGETAEEARMILRENHDISDPIKDDFRVTTMEEMMEMLDTIIGALTILLLAIIIISLVVGGVGILNVMYVTVSERTAEIGLRKAVGANYRAIMRQFLTESVIITVFGGLIGVVAGILASFGLYLVANYFGLEWAFSIPLRGVIVAVSFSLLFGIVFGIAPARRAARLDPVEAMRRE